MITKVHTPKYCIACGKEVDAVEYADGSLSHTVITPASATDPADWDICGGPFAECSPTDMTEEDWDWVFSQEELLEEGFVKGCD
jgi:hypothetical protein